MRINYWIGLVLLVMVLIFITFLSLYQKPPLDWSPSYYRSDKSPLGSMIVYELMKDSRGDVLFQDVRMPPYEFLELYAEEGTYLFYNSTMDWNTRSSEAIMDWVSNGNTVMVATNSIPKNLRDTLSLRLKRLDEEFEGHTNLTFSAVNSPVEAIYNLNQVFTPTYIDLEWDDSLNYTVLGEVKVGYQSDEEEGFAMPNFVEIAFGQGRFLIHSEQSVFSNYFLLEEQNLSYLEAVLSYLPDNQPLYQDHFYKVGRVDPQSPLYVLIENKSLKMAYYCILILGLCWVIFEGKRKQRAIPVQREAENQTLYFSETLAKLYLKKSAHSSMVNYQIQFLMDYVMRMYRIDLNLKNSNSWKMLAEKTGRSQQSVEEDMNLLARIGQLDRKSNKELLKVNEIVTAYTDE
ncbi:DUF4350 domain-containing protein [Pleomorphovibrio marinus]|uniref:DUF4350 domain-containing protein n=1 Tax=Pleomorphovibrio marinus TaxID=2164132 RepID=UPI000E0C25A5|nr:DUF4350 domain-containing protein [Pleomorphovibrio marinus]